MGLGFGVVGGFEVLTRLTDEDGVGVGITTDAEVGVVDVVEGEDLVTATELLLGVSMGSGVPLGGSLGAMEGELIEKLEQ